MDITLVTMKLARKSVTPDTKEWTAKIETSLIQTIPNVHLLVRVSSVGPAGTRPVVVWMDTKASFVRRKYWSASASLVSTEEHAEMKSGRTIVTVPKVSYSLFTSLVIIMFSSRRVSIFDCHSFIMLHACSCCRIACVLLCVILHVFLCMKNSYIACSFVSHVPCCLAYKIL